MELEERANLVALHGAGDAGTAAAPGNEIFDSHGILLSMLLTPPSQARSLPAGSGGVAHCLGGLHLIDLMHVFLAGRIRAARGDLDPPRLQSLFPEERQKNEVAYQFLDASEGDDSAEGSWAQGVSPDGKGQFSYARLQALSDDTGDLSPVDPRIYGTPPEPVPAMAAE
jgi:hypothetical protein